MLSCEGIINQFESDDNNNNNNTDVISYFGKKCG